MPTYPNALLYLPATSGGLGLPRLSTYTNACKWSMAQQAFPSGTDAATAAGDLLQRAARYSGCDHPPLEQTPSSAQSAPPLPGGGRLGLHATNPHPVTLQQGLCYSPHSFPLALSIPPHKGKKTSGRARGLHT